MSHSNSTQIEPKSNSEQSITVLYKLPRRMGKASFKHLFRCSSPFLNSKYFNEKFYKNNFPEHRWKELKYTKNFCDGDVETVIMALELKPYEIERLLQIELEQFI